MDNLNNGFTNPNAPSNSTTGSSFGGVNPVQQYNQMNSVNDVATQNPVMDPMSASQAPFGSTVNPPMDNAVTPVTDDTYKEDLEALKSLADELNAVQNTTPAPTQPVENTTFPLGSSDIEVGNPIGTSEMSTPSFDTTVPPVVEPSPYVGEVAPAYNDVPSFDSNVSTPVVPEVPVSQPSTEMDMNALSEDPWTASAPVVEETPIPIPEAVTAPSVDSSTMASDLDALNSTSGGFATPTMDTPITENNSLMGGMDTSPIVGTPSLVDTTPVEQESTPVDSTPAFANMPSDLSQPLSSVQDVLPVEDVKEEVANEDIVNTLAPKEEGKEGNILIIVLVVLIVALIAAIGYFAYQIFLS